MNAEEFNRLRASNKCLFCDTAGLGRPIVDAEQGLWTVKCTNCGTYLIDESAIADLQQHWKKNFQSHMPLVSYRIRRMQRADPPYISPTWLQEVCESDLEFPNAFEQVENLIIFMAENLMPGGAMKLDSDTCQAAVGAIDGYGLAWVIEQAEDQGWVKGVPVQASNVPYALLNASLTLAGWEWYDQIGRHKNSRIAFMVMQYGDALLNSIVEEYFRPAVAKTGFELRLLTDRPAAGVIDTRLRVEIRRSRFVIADLSHHNCGAYWEAGFGEGLGKPVIFTCKDSVLAEKEEKKVHFDTRNCLIVPWNETDPLTAAVELKFTIRNTLPDEANLEDPK